METLSIFHLKVLQILAGRYGMNCTLEELTSILTPIINANTVFTEDISIKNEKQARLLYSLIVLNDGGYIFLNSTSDRSSITIKGLIKINNKIFCN